MLSQSRPDKAGRKTSSRASQAGRSGRNASRACQNCRRRKSKCDAREPCSTCELYHDECTYTAEQDGRRPAAKSYVSALEERVKVLERMLKQGSALGEDEASEGREGEDGAGQETAELGLDRLKLDEETLELLQYGPTSAFQHLPEPQDGRDLSLSPAASLPAFSPHALFDTASAGPLDWRRHLPHDDDLEDWDEPLHDSLLALFFCFFNPWCWWCDEEAFRRDMAICLGSSLPSPPTRLSGYSPLLHNAILALACALSDDQRAKESGAAKSLARQAKALVEEEGERPTLSTLQGLLLVGSFHSGNRLQGLGYLYSGVGFRMSQTLGLGIDCSGLVRRGVLTEAIKTSRDRAMWSAFTQDKLWSSYVGRNPTLKRAELEVALPVIDPVRDREPWAPVGVADEVRRKTTPSFMSSTFHWLCRLAIIQEKILSTVYALRVALYSSPVQNRVSEINLELEAWSADLPLELKIAPQTSRPPPPHIIMLNAMQHFVLILLHRPFYTRHNSSTNLPINDTAIRRCNASATRIVALFELYQRSPGLRYVPISATQIAFSAATTHLLALVNAESGNQQKRAAELRETTTACVRILREMGKAYECAHATADIFEGLVDKWAGPPQSANGGDEVGGTASSSAPAHPPLPPQQLTAVQALDPHSDLAKELLRLGWTPPTTTASLEHPSLPLRTPPVLLPNPPHPLGPSLASPPPSQLSADFLAHFSSTPSTSSLPPYSTYPNLAASQAPTAGLPSWPFLMAPSAGGTAFSAPPHQHYPLADDVLAGLLSSEGRAASDATGGAFFPAPGSSSSTGTSLFGGAAPGGAGFSQPGWFGFGSSGV
ncbi:hypothetical protein JCM8208_000581 [Rhodotorula glutinis]